MSQSKVTSDPTGHQNGEAEQLISFIRPPNTGNNDERTTIEINTPLLDRMVKVCGTRPICIYCVCGPARQGKSFLLGYMIRRLIAMEKGDVDLDWMCKTGDRRNLPLSATGAFEFRNQAAHLTEGIMVWNRPFIVSNDGQEYAILLVDTQGTFDSSTSTRDMTAIVSLSLLTCSVMVFNFFTNLQEDTLSSFNTYVQYGKLALEKTGENLRPFQKLVFLIRDWNNSDEFPFGGEGGMEFLENKLEIVGNSSREATEVRKSIRQCFEEIECYLMPYIGFKATLKSFTGSAAEVEQMFEEKLEDFIGNLILADALIPKQVLGKTVTARELQLYLNQYVDTFNSDDIPQPLSVWEATSQIFFQNLVEKCARKYAEIIQNADNNQSYLTMKDLGYAHQQGLKESQTLFEDAKNVGDDQKRNQYSSDLVNRIKQVYKRLQESHKQRRENFIMSTTKNARDTFKSELNIKFPLSIDDLYSDTDIQKTATQMKATAIQNFLQQFPNEEAAMKEQLTRPLDKDLDEIITERVNSNRLEWSDAEKKISSMVTQLVSKYKTDMLHLFSANKFVSSEQFKEHHTTLTKDVNSEMKTPKNPELAEKFFAELNVNLAKEYENFENKHKLHLQEVQIKAEKVIGRVAIAQEEELRGLANDNVAINAELFQEINSIVLDNFVKTWNPYPEGTQLHNQLQQKLKSELEKVSSNVLRDVQECVRKYEDSHNKAVITTLAYYKQQLKATHDEIKANNIEDVVEQERRFNEVFANAVDKYDSEPKTGTRNNSFDYKTELKQKLATIFHEHIQEAVIERKVALEKEAEQSAEECLNEYKSSIRKAMKTVKSLEELETAHKTGLKAAVTKFKQKCRAPEEQFRDQLVNTLGANIDKVYSEALEYAKTRIKNDSLSVELVLQDCRKRYHDEMAKHFEQNRYAKSSAVREFHLQAVNHVISTTKDLSEQLKDNLKQELEAHLSEYIAKNDMILNTRETPAIGIDLGTTNLCVGVWTPKGVEIIPNFDQGNINATPSFVTLGPKGKVTSWGKASKDSMQENPDCTVFDAKRLLGRPFTDEKVQLDIKLWPFTVVDDKNRPKIKIGGESYHPEQISGKLLFQLRKMAEKHLKLDDGAIKNAVITVPNYFTDGQRQATIDAGELAGLNVLQIINEPTAAAVAYKIQKLAKNRRKVLIFDLGGGTFDVAVADIFPGAEGVKVLGADGNTHLGGQDFDSNLMEYVAAQFKLKENIDIFDGINSSNKTTRDEVRSRLFRLRIHLEQFKKTLSTSDKVQVTMINLIQGKNLDVEVTKAKFNELNEHLFQETITLTEKCLQNAKVGKGEIEEVLLIGGSTRIPRIQELLQQLFVGKSLDISINPDEAVAYGAAVKAAMLHGKKSREALGDFDISEVIPMSLGTRVSDGSFSVIIPQNTTYPVTRSREYTTAEDNQKSMDIDIYQGEKPVARDNKLLGNFNLSGIPPAPKNVEMVDITLDINAQGVLHVSAISRSSGSTKSITITEEKQRLTRDEINHLKRNDRSA